MKIAKERAMQHEIGRGGKAMVLLVAFLLAGAGHALAAPATQTIVLIRHGEKPPGGLGRLDCRGLNRANALPPVLARQFGHFDAIFAPDPEQRKKDEGTRYLYRRPLETVTPLSKETGVPVETPFGYKQIGPLERLLESSGYRGATVLVAWEHKRLVKLARDLLKHNGGDARQVGRWPGTDFDSIYIVRIVRDGTSTQASFEHGRQELDGKVDNCPDGR